MASLDMTGMRPELRMQRRLIDTLYGEAMVLADEARSYFDEAGRDDRDALDPLLRVSFSCESLKVTTRLMHVIAWVMIQRAVEAGEVPATTALDPRHRLGPAPVTDAVLLAQLPSRARDLIEASTDLHRRVALFDIAQGELDGEISPVASLQQRIATAF